MSQDQSGPDCVYMQEALALARHAQTLGEVPVGAVMVCGGEIIARAHNRRELDRMATAHAELLAIEAACRAKNSWRLTDCTLYVTLEPCPMCAGAIINARVGRVVYGAKDARAGAMGSLLSLPSYPLNHYVDVSAGVLERECREVLQAFFREKR